MSDILLSIKNLSKTYKRSHLGRTTFSRGIENLNLDIPRGEVFGLLGLNGAGKTTTIKLILGLLFPTQGKITLMDLSIPHPAAQKNIGYLPEVPYFYRHLNPQEVLCFYASLSKMDPKIISDRVQEVLKIVRMDHVRKKPMREFSKGMLQRIGFAQAILHDPELLILDEPVTGLDPMGVRRSRQLIQEFNQQGKTIFFSSHSISELEKLTHRVGILVNGRLARIVQKQEWAKKEGKLEEIFVDSLKENNVSLEFV